MASAREHAYRAARIWPHCPEGRTPPDPAMPWPCPGHSGLALAVGTPRPWLCPGHCPGHALAILAFDVRHKPNSALAILAILAILAKFRQCIGIPRPQPAVRRRVNCRFPAPFPAACKCTYRQPPLKAGRKSSTLDEFAMSMSIFTMSANPGILASTDTPFDGELYGFCRS